MIFRSRARVVLLTAVLFAPLLYPDPGRLLHLTAKDLNPQHVFFPNSIPILLLLFAFGLLNALVSTPGTLFARIVGVAACLAAFHWPYSVLFFFCLAWLVWPAAFTVSWALASPANDRPYIQRKAQFIVVAVIGIAAVASFMYRVLFAIGLQQTAALFVGIPAVLAVVATLAPNPRTAVGVATQAVTVCLLGSLIFLQEGILCVAMSAPLFYVVGIVVAGALQARHRDRGAPIYSMVVLLAIVPMSLEGVFPATTFSRDETVSARKTVHVGADRVGRAMFEAPRLDRRLPPYLRLGFPRPVSTRIDLDAVPPRWTIDVRGGEMLLNGMEPRTGTLTLDLVESRPGHVMWREVSDTSHMTHFLTWRAIVVDWRPVTADTTEVTWTMSYERGLDPAWYFGPMERYAARLAAGYLVDSVATP